MNIKIFTIFTFICLLQGCFDASDEKLTLGNKLNNSPPSFQGSVNYLIKVNEVIDTQLNASDPDGDTLTYTTFNFPTWLTLDSNTGKITGTPTDHDIGTYSDIRISISDGNNTVTAGPYTIRVTDELFSIEINWMEVTQDVNGNDIDNIAGYKIYIKDTLTNYDQEAMVEGSSKTSHDINRLAPGTYNVTVSSLLASGLESEQSDDIQIILQ